MLEEHRYVFFLLQNLFNQNFFLKKYQKNPIFEKFLSVENSGDDLERKKSLGTYSHYPIYRMQKELVKKLLYQGRNWRALIYCTILAFRTHVLRIQHLRIFTAIYR